MRAGVFREGKVQVREIPDPTPGPGEILVRSRACAICASDLHFMDCPEGYFDDGDGSQPYNPQSDVVLGHEYCAEIVDYGPQTERKWKKGARISSIPVLLRESGRRIIGFEPESPGGFGEFFLMTEKIAQVVETDLPDEFIAVADAMAVGWYYARASNVRPNEIPMVIGCGAIGLSIIASLKRLGVGPIMAADFNAGRRRTAGLMGADVLIDPAEISPFKAWRDLADAPPKGTSALLAEATPKRCVVFECVGVPGVLNNVLMSCERYTRIFSAGGPPEGEHLHTLSAKRKGLNIQFSGGPLLPDWNAAFKEVAEGRLDVTPMLGPVVGLDDFPAALQQARDANSPPRIVVAPFK